jgi:hypothetical protein
VSDPDTESMSLVFRGFVIFTYCRKILRVQKLTIAPGEPLTTVKVFYAFTNFLLQLTILRKVSRFTAYNTVPAHCTKKLFKVIFK